METCTTGKRIYYSQEMAEEALIVAWSRNNYRDGGGPVNVYQCEHCGNWHWTSQGDVNVRLKEEMDSGRISRELEANRWAEKWGRR